MAVKVAPVFARSKAWKKALTYPLLTLLRPVLPMTDGGN